MIERRSLESLDHPGDRRRLARARDALQRLEAQPVEHAPRERLDRRGWSPAGWNGDWTRKARSAVTAPPAGPTARRPRRRGPRGDPGVVEHLVGQRDAAPRARPGPPYGSSASSAREARAASPGGRARPRAGQSTHTTASSPSSSGAPVGTAGSRRPRPPARSRPRDLADHLDADRRVQDLVRSARSRGARERHGGERGAVERPSRRRMSVTEGGHEAASPARRRAPRPRGRPRRRRRRRAARGEQLGHRRLATPDPPDDRHRRHSPR